MSNVLLRPSIDALVREDKPTTNYGGLAFLTLDGGGGGDNRQSFIHFSRVFPLGATILQATLTFYLRGTWSGSQEITVKRVTTAWSETRINWNNRPSVSATHAASATVTDGVEGEAVTFDVTDILQDVSNGGAWRGFRLELDTDVIRRLFSSEYPTDTLRPALAIEWSDPPEAPVNLAPAGERAVGSSTPFLLWDSGVTQQASSQVQISTSTDFSSPEYDSTKLSNDEAGWDLSNTAYTGVPDGETRYWRVRIWDETDLESDWSDVAIFERQSQGVLTITAPGATTGDLTPEITWTFTATQESRQITLFRVEDSGDLTIIYRSVRQTTTDMSLVIPANTIHSGPTYRARVTVWDDVDRQALPGDPDWVRAEQDFVYDRAGGPDPTTDLVASPLPASPGVELTWEAASAPDFFSLAVDGIEIEQRIDPDDVHVSGTSYAMIYWGAKPRVETLYEVEAVEDIAGELDHSEGNAQDSATTRPRGIWLVDADDSTAVEIDGKEDIGQAIGESGTTFDLVGRRSPVRITDAVRGYEGTINGVVQESAVRDTFLELKGRLKPLRLVAGDSNIMVYLESVAAAPTTLGVDEIFAVSFSFFQIDDFTFEVAGL